MLYKLERVRGEFKSIEPVPFAGLPSEKALEELLAQNLWDVLFEGSDLMPIFQERAWQPEADIYALDKAGNLAIFELKCEAAHEGAVHQILRYCEKAAGFSYERLESMLRGFRQDDDLDLQEEHRGAFDLEHPLDRADFNRRQRLIIVGSAGDEALIRNVDYWRSQGLWLDFIPYRTYAIGGEHYFEFYSPPYDLHSNPADRKGVIFDTNLSYDEDAIWYMCDEGRVAAFGSIKGIVHSLNKGDTVFLYHSGHGIVAAGRVKSDTKEDTEWDALYRDLEWLTSRPKKERPIRAFSAAQIKKEMGFGFFWATTMKPPYLDDEETTKLLKVVESALE